MDEQRPNPLTHRCDVPDIDYSKVQQGSLRCTVCRASWMLNPTRGWVRNPQPTQRRSY